jgi:hypothetical protein
MIMAGIVLRVRLIGGDQLDVSYEEPDTADVDQVTEHAVSALAQDSGLLRAYHGDRLVVLFGRGVAAVEVAPRGAVLLPADLGSVVGFVLEGELELGAIGDHSALVQVNVLLDNLSHPQIAERPGGGPDRLRCRVFP